MPMSFKLWQEVVMFVLTLCCWCQCTSGHHSLVSSPCFLSPLLLPSSAPPLSPWLSSSGIPSPAPRLASSLPPVPERLESSPTGWSPSRPATEDRDTQPGPKLWILIRIVQIFFTSLLIQNQTDLIDLFFKQTFMSELVKENPAFIATSTYFIVLSINFVISVRLLQTKMSKINKIWSRL